jgi:hypothetical protein
MDDILRYSNLSNLPRELQSQVNDYIEFLLSKYKKDAKNRTPKFGSAKGKIKMSEDFNAPLDDFKEYA